MISKVPLTLFVSAVLAFACGPRARNEATISDDAQRVMRATNDAPLVPSLAVNVEKGVTFEFSVVNGTKKKLEVSFNDGRTHELVVLDSLGREVWRWSEGRMFTQSVQNRVLRTSDALTYEEEWEAPAPGRYTAVAMLTSRNYPVEQRTEFTVPQM